MSARFLAGQLEFMQQRGWSCAVGVGKADDTVGASKHGFDAGVDVFEVGFDREIRLLSDLRSLIGCIRLMRSIRPELVNVSTPKAALVGMTAAWILRVPNRVYVVRGLRYETMTGVRRHVFLMIERFVARRAHAVVFNSRSLRAVAEADGVVKAGRGKVLAGGSGNGIATERFAQRPDRQTSLDRIGLAPEGKTIGFVGRLTRDKGIEELVEAFLTIAAEDRTCRLLVIGSFEEGDAVDDRTVSTIRDHERIHHLGWIDDVDSVYGALDILAFPSHREGLPNVPLEAQLCGVPIVGFRATGTIDAVDEPNTGLLVEIGDTAALADGIARLLADDDLRRTMGRAGQDWVRSNFAQQRVWAALDDVYQSLVV